MCNVLVLILVLVGMYGELDLLHAWQQWGYSMHGKARCWEHGIIISAIMMELLAWLSCAAAAA